MELAKIQVSGVQASVITKQKIPAGIIGATVTLEYTDPVWDGLSKTVVFRGEVTKDVIDAGAEVIVPHEAVATPGYHLHVGVYGVDADNNVAIPTLWADLGCIRDAADPSGDESADPRFPPWEEVRKQIGDLAELSTETKKNLVAAINEVAKDGGKVKTVDEVEPDENGNIALPKSTQNDALELLAEMGIAEPVADENGAIFTDENGIIYVF